MEQKDPKEPQRPQKAKRPPVPTENLLQSPGTPKKPKVFFSPTTPAIPTPETPTAENAFALTSKVEKQLGNVILISGDHYKEEGEEDEELIENKKEHPRTRIFQKEPVPAEIEVNTYRGLTQHLLALLRTTREYSPLKLAQLRGLTQVLRNIISLLTLNKVNPEKIPKLKKIAVLLANFIENNASPKISENQFNKNSLAFYIQLRFNQNQQNFLIQLLNHLNTSEEHDDSIQTHIVRTTQNWETIFELLLLLKKNGADFEQHFLKFLEQRFEYFDDRLLALNRLSLQLQKLINRFEPNHLALDFMIFTKKSRRRELKEEYNTISKELANLPQEDSGPNTFRKNQLKNRMALLDKLIAGSKNETIDIKKELETLENKIDNVKKLQNSFELCTKNSQEIEKTFENIHSTLQENTRQLDSTINTLLSNGEEILTFEEMQPSPHTPKYVSPAPVVKLTPNTETKLFISNLEKFVATLEAEVKSEANARKEEKEKQKVSRQEINPPAHVREIPTFEDAFPALQEQKAILENYSRELDENTAEYAAVQQQINFITQHIANSIFLLQQNHQLIANLAQQKKQDEKLSREKTPFKIFTSLKRDAQTPASEKKPSPARTPLAPRTFSHELSNIDSAREVISVPPEKKPAVVEPSFSPVKAFTLDAPTLLDEAHANYESPGSESSFAGTQIVEDDDEANFISNKNYIIHEVLGDGECGLTAFGITRDYAYTLLCENMNRVKYLLRPAVEEALLTQDFHKYLEDNHVDLGNRNQIIRAYIDYDVRHRRIDHGWSHPAILQALAEIQGIGLRIWRRDDQGRLIPHRTNEYDYAEHIPRGATQITDLVFVNGNHFNLVELRENIAQPNPNYLSSQFFAAPEPSQKRARVFYLSPDEAFKEFTEISSRLKNGIIEHLRIFTDEQRLDLDNVQTLFSETIVSIEQLIEQVQNEEVVAELKTYSQKLSLLMEDVKAFSPKDYLEKAYTNFVGPLEKREDNRKPASPPRL